MTYWLTEDAFMPMLTGGFVSVVLSLMAYSARNRIVMYLALAIATITAGVIAIEQVIVTDREQVTDLVYQLARHARKNEIDAIASYISASEPQTADRFRNRMSRYTVEACSIVGIHDFSVQDSIATIEFVVWGQGSEKRGGLKGAANPLVILKLRKDKNQSWKIVDYAASDPRAGLKL